MKKDQIKTEESTVVTSVEEIPTEIPTEEKPVEEGTGKPAESGVEMLRPDQWAIKKGLLKLRRDGSIDYQALIPWQFDVMKGLSKWPDPNADPTFKITEESFNKAFDLAKGF